MGNGDSADRENDGKNYISKDASHEHHAEDGSTGAGRVARHLTGARSTTIEQQRESWKVRALMVEAQLLEATAKIGNNADRQNVSDVRYASLKRYLAKRFHPDYAPGQGIEKIVRNEIFKEIWNEVDRLDQGALASRSVTARSSSAA